jgi:hypothetical protein
LKGQRRLGGFGGLDSVVEGRDLELSGLDEFGDVELAIGERCVGGLCVDCSRVDPEPLGGRLGGRGSGTGRTQGPRHAMRSCLAGTKWVVELKS